MSRAQRALALLLRVEAAIVFCALPAVVMPTSWMAAVHASLGLGELPRAPIVEYLTRSLSMLYVGWAPLLWVMAGDLRRYLPLVWVFGWLSLLGGFTFLVLDLCIGMPPAWVVTEAAMVLGFAVVGLLLTWLVQREAPPPQLSEAPL
jgi:hypothetical protein